MISADPNTSGSSCPICDTELKAEEACDHLLAAARLLRIVQATHPEWDLGDCEAYLRDLFSGDLPPKQT